MFFGWEDDCRPGGEYRQPTAGDDLKSPAGLTVCMTPGLAPGPTLSSEYERTLPFTFLYEKVSFCCLVAEVGHQVQFVTPSGIVLYIG